MPERDWLYDAIEGMRRDHRESLAQLRLDMNKGFDGIWDEMKVQNGRVRKSEDRLTVIETERNEEDKQALKQGGLFGAIGGGLITGVVFVIKAILGK